MVKAISWVYMCVSPERAGAGKAGEEFEESCRRMKMKKSRPAKESVRKAEKEKVGKVEV